MRGVDSNKQAGPLCQRPDYKSSANALVSLQWAQGKEVPHIAIQERTRQDNTLDPAVQQHLQWLSFNWPTYFSSSSSSISKDNSTWWSSSSWDHKWQDWHSGMWQTIGEADLSHSSHTISDNIVMWENRHSSADWVCFKTQTLLVILRTRNQPQEESCIFLEVEHLFLSVGCARNKLMSRTVLQSPRLFLYNNVQPKHTSIQENGSTLHSKTEAQKVKRRQKVDQLSDVDYVPTNTHSSQNESQLYISEDNEAVIKWELKDEVRRWDTCQEPTELRLIGCSTETILNPRSKSNMLTPKTNLLTF